MVKIILFLSFIFTTIQAQSQSFELYLEELTQKFNVPQIVPDSLEKTNAILLDTREIEEFKVSHIQGAVYVGYDEFSMEKLDSIPKSANIIVYCSVGYRSSLIAQQLLENGFNNVRNLYGGIFYWANQNKKIVKDSLPTDSLHTYNAYWGRFVNNPQITKMTGN